MIGAQQSESMNLALEKNDLETYNRYFEGTKEKFLGYSFRQLDPGLQQAAMDANPAIKESLEAKLDEALVNIEGREGMSDEDKSERKELIQSNFEADSQAIKMAFNTGGRRALTLTAMVPGAMVIGFLILAIYYKSIGGYKVIRLDENDNEPATSDGSA